MTELTSAQRLTLQAKILCTLCWKLAQCGAETRLIMQSAQIMSKALGIVPTALELGFDRTGVHVKLSSRGHSVHEYRAIAHFGINLYAVSALYRLCLKAERGECGSLSAIYQAIEHVPLKTYPQPMIIALAALAAAGFTLLNGGTLSAAGCAATGGLGLMLCRLMMLKRRFFEIFAVMCAALVGSLGAGLCGQLFRLAPEQISLGLMATSLLLVPGFPLMNGFLDIFKGYLATGIIRLCYGLTIIFGAAIGLLGGIELLALLQEVTC